MRCVQTAGKQRSHDGTQHARDKLLSSSNMTIDRIMTLVIWPRPVLDDQISSHASIAHFAHTRLMFVLHMVVPAAL